MHWKTYLPKSSIYSLPVLVSRGVWDKIRKNVAHLFVRTPWINRSAGEPSRHCARTILIRIFQSQAYEFQRRFCKGGGLYYIHSLENYCSCWGDCWTWSNAVSTWDLFSAYHWQLRMTASSTWGLSLYTSGIELSYFNQWHPTQDEWNFFLYVLSIDLATNFHPFLAKEMDEWRSSRDNRTHVPSITRQVTLVSTIYMFNR